MKSFLGQANYYRAHTPSVAVIASPLSDSTVKAQPDKVHLEEAQETAFIKWQKCSIMKPMLRLVDYGILLVLLTDASNNGLGAALR